MNKDQQAETEADTGAAAATEAKSADEKPESIEPEVAVEAAAPADGEHTAAQDAAADAEEAAHDIEEAGASLEQLQSQLDEARDAALRAAAEAQNARRRAEQDVEKARKFALERMASDLLPVVDNLERALEAAGEATEAAAITEGVDLTLRSFSDVLTKHSIEALNPVGEPFDPQLHQAMTMVPNPDMEPNTVMDVMQKGYTLNGRLLRPAMVVVSKAPE